MRTDRSMKVVVYGYGVFGKRVINQLKSNYIEIIGIIDNYKESADEYRLWNEESFIDEQVDVDYIVFAMKAEYSSTKKLIMRLINIGYKLLYVPIHYFWYENTMKKGIDFLKDCALLEKEPIEYIEFVIQESCNLNCKGCAQCSPLYSEQEYVDIETYIKDIMQLKKVVSNVMNIFLIGGEVLLRPDLDLYIEAARKTFPGAKINIASNGILLPLLDQKVVKAIRENGVFVYISSYPPTMKMRDAIDSFARDNGIIVKFDRRPGDVKDKFQKLLFREKNPDGGCCSCIAPVIYRGKYMACGVEIVMGHFNKYFGTDFPEDEGYDLHDDQLTLDTFRKRIYSNIPLCEYCVLREKFRYEDKYSFQWEAYGKSVPKKEDWIVEI